MPLSEDEQRILRQIEEQLQRDPSFRSASSAPARAGRRSAVGSVAATVVLLGATVMLLAVSPYLSFVAFVAAVITGLVAERRLRDMAEQTASSLGDAVRQRNPRARRPTRD